MRSERLRTCVRVQSRAVGGRLATVNARVAALPLPQSQRRGPEHGDALSFDAGAQYFTVRSAELAALVQSPSWQRR